VSAIGGDELGGQGLCIRAVGWRGVRICCDPEGSKTKPYSIYRNGTAVARRATLQEAKAYFAIEYKWTNWK